MMAIRRSITKIPEVLMIDPGLDRTPTNRNIWARPNWLPREIGITCQGLNVNIVCFEGEQIPQYRNYPSSEIYELVGLVVDIGNAEQEKHHLVSFIDGLHQFHYALPLCTDLSTVAISEREPTQQAQWHLFNDFMVGPVSQQEALNFSPQWKTPVLLAYQKQSARHYIDDRWKQYLDLECLYKYGSMK